MGRRREEPDADEDNNADEKLSDEPKKLREVIQYVFTLPLYYLDMRSDRFHI